MKAVYQAPSFYIHIITWILIFLAVGLIIRDYSTIQTRDSYDIILLLLVFIQVLTIHGLTHLGLESIYKYNPLSFLFKKEQKIEKEIEKNK